MSEKHEAGEQEPNAEEIAEACRGTLPDEVCEAIIAEGEDALGFTFTALMEAGIDAEEFLRDRGILE